MSSQLTALLAAILWLQATAVPTGNHTCTGVVKHPVNVLVNVTEPVTFRSYTWCLRVPPRCSKYTVQLKDRVKLHVEMHNKTITVCCEDYVEMEGRCVPACPKGADCPFMRCNRTNHCHCTPGYTGLYCNEACPRGLWGKDCKRPCDCPSGYTCHHLTGDCFVDDRPPRRTTTPTTTTTTTTRPTTIITTPTTEGTTLETVKTPVFRFPPPPWVESAGDSKKTTTREVKKEEAPPTNGMDVIQETYEVTTKKALFEVSLVSNKTSDEKSTTEFFNPPPKEEKINIRVVTDSTNFRELETIGEFPKEPILPTISSKSIDISTDESQNKDENSIKIGATAAKEMTTFIQTSPTPEFQNTLELHTVTTESPLLITFTADGKTTTRKSPADVVHTPAPSVDTEPTYFVTNKLLNIATKRPTKETASTKQISINTNPVENTIENTMKTQTLATSTSSPPAENTVQILTAHEKNSTFEPTSSLNPRFLFPPIESPRTTTPITKVYKNIIENEPTLGNQHQSTTPILMNPTESIHRLEEKQYTGTLTNFETLTEKSNTESILLGSTLNNETPVTLTKVFSTPSLTSTTNISIRSSSSIPNHENTSNNSLSTASTTPTNFSHIISNSTTIPFPFLIHLTTEATTMTNVLTTTVTSDTKTTTVNPATIKSITIPTTIEGQTDAVLNISPQLSLPTTTISTTKRIMTETAIPVLNLTHSTSSPSSTTVTPALTPTAKPTTVTAHFPVTSTKIIESTFSVSKEIPENESKHDTTESNIKEKERTTIPMPDLATEHFKDFNAHKKLKPDDGMYSGQDKSKKKHEKIKSKNLNTKEFPSIYQTKTEKHNETIMHQTTEISLRSILQAEIFRNKVITTKSPRPTKPQPLPDLNLVTEKRPAIETINSPLASSKPNQIWYASRKQNSSNTSLKVQEQLDILKEVSEIPEADLASTELNKVMESNTIDYRQSSEEPMKKMMAHEEETNYSLTFNKIKFNMTESEAARMRRSREQGSYVHLPMILVLGLALVTLLLLTLTLWVYLKRRRQRAEPFPPCIMAYAMNVQPPTDCDSYDEAFFCPTFTNTYAEKINRELRELNYDHPRSSRQEPLYAEIFN